MADIDIGSLLITLGAEAGDTDSFLQRLRDIKQGLVDADASTKSASESIASLGTSGATAATGLNAAATAAKGAASAADTAGASFGGLADSINASFNSIENIAKRLVIRDTLLELASVVKQTAGEFEDASAQITGATGAIGDQLATFSDGLRTVMDNAVQAGVQIGNAMGSISAALSIGPGDTLNLLTTDMLNLATITGDSVKLIVQDTTQLARAWQIDPSQLDAAMQMLLNTSQQAHINLTTLETDLTKFQGLFDALGAPISGATQFIGDLSTAGLNVTGVLGAMQTAMDKLGKGGVTNLQDAMSQLFHLIEDAPTYEAGFDIASKVFGNNAAMMTEGIQAGTISLTDMYSTMDKGGSSIADQAASMETLAESFQRLKNQLADGTIGTYVTQVAHSVVDFLTDVVAFIGVIPSFVSEIGSFANAFLAPVPGIQELRSFIRGAIDDIDLFENKIREAAGVQLIGASGSAPGSLAPGTTAGSIAAGPGQESFFLGGAGITQFGAGTSVPSATAAEIAQNKAAIDALLNGTAGGNKLPTDPEYQLVARQVQLLQRQMSGKNSLVSLQSELGTLLDISINMPDVVALSQSVAQLDTDIKTKQQYGVPVDSSVYSSQTAAHTVQALNSMDQSSSEKLLGLPDPETVRANEQLILEAFNTIQDAGTQSPGFIALAWSNAQAKILADARSIGDAVTADMVLAADWSKTISEIQSMDLGTASKTLGLTTEDQAYQSLAKSAAAYQTVLDAVAQGYASSNDAANAQLDYLNKQKTALNSVGQALDDASQAQLSYLQTQKQIGSLNAEGALAMFGVSSESDLTNAVSLITAAFQKIQDAQAAGTLQLSDTAQLTVALKAVTDQIAAMGKAGETVSDDLIQKFMDLTQAVQLSSVNLQNSISALTVLPVDQANQAIDTVKAELDKIGDYYGQSSNEYQAALVAANTKITSLLQQSGQAVSDSLTQQLDATKAAIANATMTIDQAYSTLGITSAQSAQNQLNTMSVAYQKIAQDASSTWQQLNTARLNYDQAYYTSAIALGNDFSAKNYALLQVELQANKDVASQVDNAWLNASKAISSAWTTLSNDTASGITGIINGTESVSAAFLKMGEDIEAIIVKYILNQLIFTQSNLHSLQSAILGLFGAQSTGVGAAVGGLGAAPVITQTLPALSDSTAAAINAAGISFQASVDSAATVHSTAVDSSAGVFASATDASATLFGSLIEASAAAFDATVTPASVALATEVATSSITFGATVDSAGIALAGTIDGSGAGLAAEIDGAGAGLAGEIDGSGAGLAGEIDGAGGAFAAEVDGAGGAFAAEIDGAGAADAAGGIAGGLAGGIGDAIGGIADILNPIGAIGSLITGAIGDIQQAHANNLLGEIEVSTRAAMITLGGTDSPDGISEWTKVIGQKVTAMNDFNNGTLQQYLQNINIDLDNISSAFSKGAIQINATATFDSSPIVGAVMQADADIVAAIHAIGIGGTGAGGTAGGRGSAPVSDAVERATGPIRDAANAMTHASNAFTDAASNPATIIGQATPDYGTPTAEATAAIAAAVAAAGPPPPPVAGPGGNPEIRADEQSNPLGAPLTTAQGQGKAPVSQADLLSAIQYMLTSQQQVSGNSQTALSQFGDLDALLAGIDTSNVAGLGAGGYTAANISQATGVNLTQDQFDNLFTQAIASHALQFGVEQVGTPEGPNGQFSQSQLSEILSQMEQDLSWSFTNEFSKNVAGEVAQLNLQQNGQTFPDGFTSSAGTSFAAAGYGTQTAALVPTTLANPGGASGNNTSTSAPVTGPPPATGTASFGIGANDAGTVVTGLMSSANLFAVAATTLSAAVTGDYAGGVANQVASGYTADYLASLKPGYSTGLPASVVQASIGGNGWSSTDPNNPNYGAGSAALINPQARTVNISINGSQFPVGMTPAQVASALATQLRTQSALLR